MKKILSLCTALLLCCILLSKQSFAENERIENFIGLAVGDFADKYGMDKAAKWELYQDLTDAWGDFSFWPLGDKVKFMDYLDIIVSPDDFIWVKDTTLFYSNPLFAFCLERPTASDTISEELAIEKALNWAKEQGLLADGEPLKIGTALVTGDFMYGDYPERLWRIELKKEQEDSVLVWLDSAKGSLPKHTSEAALQAGMEALQTLVEEGGLIHMYYGVGTLAKVEDIPNYRAHAVYFPRENQWLVGVDTKQTDFVFFNFSDLNLQQLATEQSSG